MKSQFRLAAKLRHAAPEKSRSAGNDLPLSSEMTDWLKYTMTDTDEIGQLPDKLASISLQPLDSLSVYCPNAAIIKSQFSARPATTENMKNTHTIHFDKTKSWKATHFTEINGITSGIGVVSANQSSDIRSVDDPIQRLNVLWLNRKALLERESGEYSAAYNTLDEAIQLHIGTDDYSKADLVEYMPVNSSDPLQLLTRIESEYVIYDPSVYLSAQRIQKFYRKFHERKCIASTKVSKYYRGYKARRMLWERKNMYMQCATTIQMCVRAHNRRRRALIIKIQKWYRMRKQVKAYTLLLLRRNAARKIQQFFRNNTGRSASIKLLRIQRVLVVKLQRLFRGFMVRKRRTRSAQFR